MVIGISGKKRSGKDTFYSIFKEKVTSAKRFAFADKVKEFAVHHFNIPYMEVNSEENRFLLQGIGQMFREEVDELFWCRQVFSEIQKSRKNNPGEIAVITDVRYRNEADFILEQDNSFLIRIVNTKTELFDPHISENDLNEYTFDFVIENNGSIMDYESRVEEWISKNLPWIIL